jgi:hypothetical protein
LSFSFDKSKAVLHIVVMTQTLLQKALSVETRKNNKNEITDEIIELCVAWANDKVTYKQVQVALYGAPKQGQMTVYVTLAMGLREAIRRGLLKPSATDHAL